MKWLLTGGAGLLVVLAIGGLLRARPTSHVAHDLVMLGRITKVNVGGPQDHVDALRGSPMDAQYFVGFEIESVSKGSWPGATLGVRLHSPSMASMSSVGERQLLFLDQHALPDGGVRLTLEENQPCTWFISPCP
jgi:hypothetical protein